MKRSAFMLLAVASIAHGAEGASTEPACRAHLKKISTAVRAYRLVHDKTPEKLSDLYFDGLVASLGDFACPASGTTILLASEIDAQSDYVLETPAGPKGVVAREKVSRHGNGAGLAVLADGSLKMVAATAQSTVPSAEAGRADARTPSSSATPSAAPFRSAATLPAPPSTVAPGAAATLPSADVTHAQGTLQQGIELTRAGRLNEALMFFRNAWKSESDDFAIGMNRAAVELAVGDRPTGQRIAEALVRLQPNYPFALSLRGIAAFYNADNATAQQMFTRAQQADPRIPGHHFQQARAYHQGRVLELALQHYIIAAFMDPRQYHAAHYSMGQIYEAMNRPDLAVPAYRSFLYYDQKSQWAAEARAAVQRLQAPGRPGARAVTN